MWHFFRSPEIYNSFYELLYYPTHVRGASYLIGIILGYHMYYKDNKAQDNDVRIYLMHETCRHKKTKKFSFFSFAEFNNFAHNHIILGSRNTHINLHSFSNYGSRNNSKCHFFDILPSGMEHSNRMDYLLLPKWTQ